MSFWATLPLCHATLLPQFAIILRRDKDTSKSAPFPTCHHQEARANILLPSTVISLIE